MKFHSLMAAALLLFAMDSRATLIHQYEFNGSLEDAKGGSAMVALGGSIDAGRYVFGADQGLRMEAQLGGVYSIDMAFRFDGYSAYSRILDFTNLASDNGFYLTGGTFRLYPYGYVGGALAEGSETRLTITRDEGQMFKVYQNGDLMLSVLDSEGHANFGLNFANFFKDNVEGGNSGEAVPGEVDFIHVYDEALSAAQVQALMPAPVAEPASLGLMGAGLALLGWTTRRRRTA